MSKSNEAASADVQTEKGKKYDRQIRLWGEHGQRLLESASVCLINATAVGCETLKALVLPGICRFAIVDNANVNEADLGNNFFVDENSLGTSRGRTCMKFLEELNPDVHGSCIEESTECILAHNAEFFSSFDIVIASSLKQETLCDLSRYLWRKNIPLVYCRSLGLFGCIRLQVEEHCIVEGHDDNPQVDLRLEQPFDALKAHLECAELTKDVPWPVILYRYLQTWRADNGNRLPSNYKEKVQLRDTLRTDANERENYEEAAKAVLTALGNAGTVTPKLQAILADNACQDLQKTSSSFWILARALKDFVATHDGLLPVPGVLPDMTSSSAAYITLQNIYRQQAITDAEEVYNSSQQYLRELSLPEEHITRAQARLFCREAGRLEIVRGTPIYAEYSADVQVPAVCESMNSTMNDVTPFIAQNCCNVVSDLEDSDSLAKYYLAFRVYDYFISEHGHTPGEQSTESSVYAFKSLASKCLTRFGRNLNIPEDIIHEFCRYGGAELHAISAFIGGCAAQETIKFITAQYKPIDNTFLYNGITTASLSFRI